MICKNCGDSLPDNANFCPNCGRKTVAEDKRSEAVKKKPHGFFDEPRNAFSFLALALAAALIISYLILDSNRQRRAEATVTSSSTSEIPEKTKALIEKLKDDPSSPALNIEIGNQLFDASNYAEAAVYYRQALVIESDNVAARIDLAVCYFNIENYPQALENMRIALRLAPDHPKGLFNIGVMYMTVGQPDSTQKYWQRLITDFPSTEEAKRARELMQNM